MTLRQLLTERVLFAVSPEELEQRFHLTEDEVVEMTDIDLFELYEAIYLGELES